jgi:hypothetical protein
VLIDRRTWHQHFPWVVFAAAATVAATAWFYIASLGPSGWPGGSTLPGFTFGILGGLIILFEMLLWWRKRVRVWRIGRAQKWMRAHIWLGLLCLPLLVYHSGLRWGGVLSTVLMVLLLIVIASGIWGLAMQQFLPRQLLDRVPAETIYSQIDYLSAQLSDEADRLVETTCGPAPGEEFKPLATPEVAGGAHLVVGAVRSVGRVQGKVLETRTQVAPVPDCEPLRDFFRQSIAPFLKKGSRYSPLYYPNRAEIMFRDLKVKVPAGAHKAIDTLASFCEQRRQFDYQSRLHFWLHCWLWVHLPLSVALVVLMAVHIWVALKYW